MTTPAATAAMVPLHDELFAIERAAERARRGWTRLLVLMLFCLQVCLGTFAWRAWADTQAPARPVVPPMPAEVLGEGFQLPALAPRLGPGWVITDCHKADRAETMQWQADVARRAEALASSQVQEASASRR